MLRSENELNKPSFSKCRNVSFTGRVSRRSCARKKEILRIVNKEYNSYLSVSIAESLTREINETASYNEQTPEFVEDIRKKLFLLHEYNTHVAKISYSYPSSKEVYELLGRYVALECDVLYKTKYTFKYEKQVEERVFQAIISFLKESFSTEEDYLYNRRTHVYNEALKIFVSYVDVKYINDEEKFPARIVKNILDALGLIKKTSDNPTGNLDVNNPSLIRLKESLRDSDYGSDDDGQETASVSSEPSFRTMLFKKNYEKVSKKEDSHGVESTSKISLNISLRESSEVDENVPCSNSDSVVHEEKINDSLTSESTQRIGSQSIKFNSSAFKSLCDSNEPTANFPTSNEVFSSISPGDIQSFIDFGDDDDDDDIAVIQWNSYKSRFPKPQLEKTVNSTISNEKINILPSSEKRGKIDKKNVEYKIFDTISIASSDEEEDFVYEQTDFDAVERRLNEQKKKSALINHLKNNHHEKVSKTEVNNKNQQPLKEAALFKKIIPSERTTNISSGSLNSDLIIEISSSDEEDSLESNRNSSSSKKSHDSGAISTFIDSNKLFEDNRETRLPSSAVGRVYCRSINELLTESSSSLSQRSHKQGEKSNEFNSSSKSTSLDLCSENKSVFSTKDFVGTDSDVEIISDSEDIIDIHIDDNDSKRNALTAINEKEQVQKPGTVNVELPENKHFHDIDSDFNEERNKKDSNRENSSSISFITQNNSCSEAFVPVSTMKNTVTSDVSSTLHKKSSTMSGAILEYPMIKYIENEKTLCSKKIELCQLISKQSETGVLMNDKEPLVQAKLQVVQNLVSDSTGSSSGQENKSSISANKKQLGETVGSFDYISNDENRQSIIKDLDTSQKERETGFSTSQVELEREIVNNEEDLDQSIIDMKKRNDSAKTLEEVIVSNTQNRESSYHFLDDDTSQNPKTVTASSEQNQTNLLNSNNDTKISPSLPNYSENISVHSDENVTSLNQKENQINDVHQNPMITVEVEVSLPKKICEDSSQISNHQVDNSVHDENSSNCKEYDTQFSDSQDHSSIAVPSSNPGSAVGEQILVSTEKLTSSCSETKKLLNCGKKGEILNTTEVEKRTILMTNLENSQTDSTEQNSSAVSSKDNEILEQIVPIFTEKLSISRYKHNETNEFEYSDKNEFTNVSSGTTNAEAAKVPDNESFSLQNTSTMSDLKDKTQVIDQHQDKIESVSNMNSSGGENCFDSKTIENDLSDKEFEQAEYGVIMQKNSEPAIETNKNEYNKLVNFAVVPESASNLNENIHLSPDTVSKDTVTHTNSEKNQLKVSKQEDLSSSQELIDSSDEISDLKNSSREVSITSELVVQTDDCLASKQGEKVFSVSQNYQIDGTTGNATGNEATDNSAKIDNHCIESSVDSQKVIATCSFEDKRQSENTKWMEKLGHNTNSLEDSVSVTLSSVEDMEENKKVDDSERTTKIFGWFTKSENSFSSETFLAESNNSPRYVNEESSPEKIIDDDECTSFVIDEGETSENIETVESAPLKNEDTTEMCASKVPIQEDALFIASECEVVTSDISTAREVEISASFGPVPLPCALKIPVENEKNDNNIEETSNTSKNAQPNREQTSTFGLIEDITHKMSSEDSTIQVTSKKNVDLGSKITKSLDLTPKSRQNRYSDSHNVVGNLGKVMLLVTNNEPRRLKRNISFTSPIKMSDSCNFFDRSPVASSKSNLDNVTRESAYKSYPSNTENNLVKSAPFIDVPFQNLKDNNLFPSSNFYSPYIPKDTRVNEVLYNIKECDAQKQQLDIDILASVASNRKPIKVNIPQESDDQISKTTNSPKKRQSFNKLEHSSKSPIQSSHSSSNSPRIENISESKSRATSSRKSRSKNIIKNSRTSVNSSKPDLAINASSASSQRSVKSSKIVKPRKKSEDLHKDVHDPTKKINKKNKLGEVKTALEEKTVPEISTTIIEDYSSENELIIDCSDSDDSLPLDVRIKKNDSSPSRSVDQRSYKDFKSKNKSRRKSIKTDRKSKTKELIVKKGNEINKSLIECKKERQSDDTTKINVEEPEKKHALSVTSPPVKEDQSRRIVHFKKAMLELITQDLVENSTKNETVEILKSSNVIDQKKNVHNSLSEDINNAGVSSIPIRDSHKIDVPTWNSTHDSVLEDGKFINKKKFDPEKHEDLFRPHPFSVHNSSEFRKEKNTLQIEAQPKNFDSGSDNVEPDAVLPCSTNQNEIFLGDELVKSMRGREPKGERRVSKSIHRLAQEEVTHALRNISELDLIQQPNEKIVTVNQRSKSSTRRSVSRDKSSTNSKKTLKLKESSKDEETKFIKSENTEKKSRTKRASSSESKSVKGAFSRRKSRDSVKIDVEPNDSVRNEVNSQKELGVAKPKRKSKSQVSSLSEVTKRDLSNLVKNPKDVTNEVQESFSIPAKTVSSSLSDQKTLENEPLGKTTCMDGKINVSSTKLIKKGCSQKIERKTGKLHDTKQDGSFSKHQTETNRSNTNEFKVTQEKSVDSHKRNKTKNRKDEKNKDAPLASKKSYANDNKEKHIEKSRRLKRRGSKSGSTEEKIPSENQEPTIPRKIEQESVHLDEAAESFVEYEKDRSRSRKRREMLKSEITLVEQKANESLSTVKDEVICLTATTNNKSLQEKYLINPDMSVSQENENRLIQICENKSVFESSGAENKLISETNSSSKCMEDGAAEVDYNSDHEIPAKEESEMDQNQDVSQFSTSSSKMDIVPAQKLESEKEDSEMKGETEEPSPFVKPEAEVNIAVDQSKVLDLSSPSAREDQLFPHVSNDSTENNMVLNESVDLEHEFTTETEEGTNTELSTDNIGLRVCVNLDAENVNLEEEIKSKEETESNKPFPESIECIPTTKMVSGNEENTNESKNSHISLGFIKALSEENNTTYQYPNTDTKITKSQKDCTNSETETNVENNFFSESVESSNENAGAVIQYKNVERVASIESVKVSTEEERISESVKDSIHENIVGDLNPAIELENSTEGNEGSEEPRKETFCEEFPEKETLCEENSEKETLREEFSEKEILCEEFSEKETSCEELSEKEERMKYLKYDIISESKIETVESTANIDIKNIEPEVNSEIVEMLENNNKNQDKEESDIEDNQKGPEIVNKNVELDTNITVGIQHGTEYSKQNVEDGSCIVEYEIQVAEIFFPSDDEKDEPSILDSMSGKEEQSSLSEPVEAQFDGNNDESKPANDACDDNLEINSEIPIVEKNLQDQHIFDVSNELKEDDRSKKPHGDEIIDSIDYIQNPDSSQLTSNSIKPDLVIEQNHKVEIENSKLGIEIDEAPEFGRNESKDISASDHNEVFDQSAEKIQKEQLCPEANDILENDMVLQHVDLELEVISNSEEEFTETSINEVPASEFNVDMSVSSNPNTSVETTFEGKIVTDENTIVEVEISTSGEENVEACQNPDIGMNIKTMCPRESTSLKTGANDETRSPELVDNRTEKIVVAEYYEKILTENEIISTETKQSLECSKSTADENPPEVEKNPQSEIENVDSKKDILHESDSGWDLISNESKAVILESTTNTNIESNLRGKSDVDKIPTPKENQSDHFNIETENASAKMDLEERKKQKITDEEDDAPSVAIVEYEIQVSEIVFPNEDDKEEPLNNLQSILPKGGEQLSLPELIVEQSCGHEEESTTKSDIDKGNGEIKEASTIDEQSHSIVEKLEGIPAVLNSQPKLDKIDFKTDAVDISPNNKRKRSEDEEVMEESRTIKKSNVKNSNVKSLFEEDKKGESVEIATDSCPVKLFPYEHIDDQVFLNAAEELCSYDIPIRCEEPKHMSVKSHEYDNLSVDNSSRVILKDHCTNATEYLPPLKIESEENENISAVKKIDNCMMNVECTSTKTVINTEANIAETSNMKTMHGGDTFENTKYSENESQELNSVNFLVEEVKESPSKKNMNEISKPESETQVENVLSFSIERMLKPSLKEQSHGSMSSTVEFSEPSVSSDELNGNASINLSNVEKFDTFKHPELNNKFRKNTSKKQCEEIQETNEEKKHDTTSDVKKNIKVIVEKVYSMDELAGDTSISPCLNLCSAPILPVSTELIPYRYGVYGTVIPTTYSENSCFQPNIGLERGETNNPPSQTETVYDFENNEKIRSEEEKMFYSENALEEKRMKTEDFKKFENDVDSNEMNSHLKPENDVEIVQMESENHQQVKKSLMKNDENIQRNVRNNINLDENMDSCIPDQEDESELKNIDISPKNAKINVVEKVNSVQDFNESNVIDDTFSSPKNMNNIEEQNEKNIDDNTNLGFIEKPNALLLQLQSSSKIDTEQNSPIEVNGNHVLSIKSIESSENLDHCNQNSTPKIEHQTNILVGSTETQQSTIIPSISKNVPADEIPKMEDGRINCQIDNNLNSNRIETSKQYFPETDDSPLFKSNLEQQDISESFVNKVMNDSSGSDGMESLLKSFQSAITETLSQNGSFSLFSNNSENNITFAQDGQASNERVLQVDFQEKGEMPLNQSEVLINHRLNLAQSTPMRPQETPQSHDSIFNISDIFDFDFTSVNQGTSDGAYSNSYVNTTASQNLQMIFDNPTEFLHLFCNFSDVGCEVTVDNTNVEDITANSTIPSGLIQEQLIDSIPSYIAEEEFDSNAPTDPMVGGQKELVPDPKQDSNLDEAPFPESALSFDEEVMHRYASLLHCDVDSGVQTSLCDKSNEINNSEEIINFQEVGNHQNIENIMGNVNNEKVTNTDNENATSVSLSQDTSKLGNQPEGYKGDNSNCSSLEREVEQVEKPEIQTSEPVKLLDKAAVTSKILTETQKPPKKTNSKTPGKVQKIPASKYAPPKKPRSNENCHSKKTPEKEEVKHNKISKTIEEDKRLTLDIGFNHSLDMPQLLSPTENTSWKSKSLPATNRSKDDTKIIKSDEYEVKIRKNSEKYPTDDSIHQMQFNMYDRTKAMKRNAARVENYYKFYDDGESSSSKNKKRKVVTKADQSVEDHEQNTKTSSHEHLEKKEVTIDVESKLKKPKGNEPPSKNARDCTTYTRNETQVKDPYALDLDDEFDKLKRSGPYKSGVSKMNRNARIDRILRSAQESSSSYFQMPSTSSQHRYSDRSKRLDDRGYPDNYRRAEESRRKSKAQERSRSPHSRSRAHPITSGDYRRESSKRSSQQEVGRNDYLYSRELQSTSDDRRRISSEGYHSRDPYKKMDRSLKKNSPKYHPPQPLFNRPYSNQSKQKTYDDQGNEWYAKLDEWFPLEKEVYQNKGH